MAERVGLVAEPTERSLEWVRRRLDFLVKARQSRPLSIAEFVEYGKLCNSEDRLLGMQPDD
jgi:hypothetical protein